MRDAWLRALWDEGVTSGEAGALDFQALKAEGRAIAIRRPQQLLDCDPETLTEQFWHWASDVSASGVRLIVVDGLPCAGKSTLLSGRGIELDDFLPESSDGETPWTDLVMAGGALQSVHASITSSELTVVGGAAASLVLKDVMQQSGSNAVRRVYIKRVTKLGNHTFWDDGLGLVEHAASSRPYFQCIYRYHGVHRPWESADLIVLRRDRG